MQIESEFARYVFAFQFLPSDSDDHSPVPKTAIYDFGATSKRDPVALAIYPTAALFPHHCNANIAAFQRPVADQLGLVVLQTTRPIPSGAMLTLSRGTPTFADTHSLVEREQFLTKHFNTRCKCTRCEVERPAGQRVRTHDF